MSFLHKISLACLLYTVVCVKEINLLNYKNNHSIPLNKTRNSKFLFDVIFRVGSGLSDTFEAEEDPTNINIKQCDCGKNIKVYA